MAIYNPKSMFADEFINHEEILETLEYAEKNKNNLALIDSILEKARPKKTAGCLTVLPAPPGFPLLPPCECP